MTIKWQCYAGILVIALLGARSWAEEEIDDAEINRGKVEDLMEEQAPEQYEVKRFIKPQVPENALLVYDPWEPMNRGIYNFNARFDRLIFLPTVRGYRAITPDIVEKGVSNFFANLGEVNNLVNNLLQLQLKSSAITLSRFVVNSTIGVAGLWDPAEKFGMHSQKEDFGQTLGYWGVGSGPYLVMPFFGPSSLRDATGLGVDYVVDYNIDLLEVNDDVNKDDIRIGLTLLKAVDGRKNTAFRYYETGSPFEYELVRFAHRQLREIQIEK